MISGEKVNLRALNKNDSNQILNWINQPELRFLTGTVYPISDFEHEKWFENRSFEKVNKMFGIEDKSTQDLIGVIGFNNTDFINRSTELYIYIGEKKNTGKGLGTDALKTLIDFLFSELNLHRISLCVFSYNTRAIKAYEKTGFKTEGILRESVFKKGKYYDKLLMSILNEDNIKYKI